MSRTWTHLTLLCLGLFLVAFSITVAKPGLPPTLKADEPAYFLMALSLFEDGDLRAETEDYRRLVETYPYRTTDNLILASDDGFETAHFGKPYLYSLLAVPFVALSGANGLVAFNMVLFVAMIWMGAVYLGRFNPEAVALVFSLAFFFISPTFAYVFWLQPELLNMASIMASLFFVFHRFGEADGSGGRLGSLWGKLFNDGTAPAWSGALIALAVYNKPNLAMVGLPIVFYLWRRRGIRAAIQWCLAAAVVGAVITLGSVALTGHPTAYLGQTRSSVRVVDPEKMDEVLEVVNSRLFKVSTTANSWSWMFDSPPIDWEQFWEDSGYFFWGRHTGFLLYFPFGALALLLLALHRRRSVTRWLLVATAFAFGFFFILKIPHNWHGGSGFVGNRYFINVYPVFLFLVTTIRPVWTLPLMSAIGGLFLGPIVFTPFGAPVPKPTLQAHVRSLPYRLFPHELSIRQAIPGYESISLGGVTLMGRKDQWKRHGPQPGVAWARGADRTDISILSAKRVDSLFFEVRTFMPNNRVVLELDGRREVVEFVEARGARRRRIVEIAPRQGGRLTHDHRKTYHAYELTIDTSRGKRVADKVDPGQVFFVGAQISYLGRREQLEAPEHYRFSWLSASAPEATIGGSTFEVPVRIRSECQLAVSSEDSLRVLLSYRWIDAAGEDVTVERQRTRLPGEIEPGETFETVMTVRAPTTSGTYTLELDAVRDPVAWFSQRGSDTRRIEVRVEPR